MTIIATRSSLTPFSVLRPYRDSSLSAAVCYSSVSNCFVRLVVQESVLLWEAIATTYLLFLAGPSAETCRCQVASCHLPLRNPH